MGGAILADVSQAAAGDAIPLTVIPDAGYRIDRVVYSDGSEHLILPDSAGAYAFTMPASDVTVSAVFYPPFIHADFTLPSALAAIEESAFEGLAGMTAVFVPDTCASIGKDAFKDCANLTQIRLPKNCAIDPAAFGDQTIYVYAPAGGTTEAYCGSHENLIFVEEK